MPDDYDRDREGFDSNTRGRIFENGTGGFFRDRERGYTKQVEIPVPGRGEIRRFDKAQVKDGRVRSIEDKSGGVRSPNDLKEFRNDRILLEKGVIDHHLLRTVEGEPISREARELIEGLVRDFPGRFAHQIISRADAREIWARGRELERGQQLELPGVREKARQQKARQREARQQERARERENQSRERIDLVKKRDTPAREQPQVRTTEQPQQKSPKSKSLEREPAEQARTRENNRDKAKPPVVAKERTEPAQQAKDGREREESQARAMINSLDLNLSKEQKEQVQAILREGRENQRKDLAREIEAGRGHQPPPPAPHRTPEQERENARAIAKEAGLSPEITGILGLNTSNPHPTIDVDQARLHAESEAARMKNATRERERAREERERNSRYRGD